MARRGSSQVVRLHTVGITVLFTDRPWEIGGIEWHQLRDQLDAATRTGEVSAEVRAFVPWRTAVLQTEIQKRGKLLCLLSARMNAKRSGELDAVCQLDRMLLEEYRVSSPACADYDACEVMAGRTARNYELMPREVRTV